MLQKVNKPVTWPDIHELSAQIGKLEVRAGIFERLAEARLGYAGPDSSPSSSREMLDDVMMEPLVPLVSFASRSTDPASICRTSRYAAANVFSRIFGT